MSITEREVELEAKTQSWPDAARAMVITDASTYEAAGEKLKAIAELCAEIDETFDSPIAAAHKLHKELLAKKAKHYRPLDEAQRIIKSGRATWRDEQERIRRAEEQRLRDIERKAEEERRLAAAIEAESKGKAEAAEKILATPLPVASVRVESSVPTGGGFVPTKTYSAKVTNLAELVDFVAANHQFIAYLEPVMPVLNMQARSLKQTMAIPGVELVEQSSERAKGR